MTLDVSWFHFAGPSLPRLYNQDSHSGVVGKVKWRYSSLHKAEHVASALWSFAGLSFTPERRWEPDGLWVSCSTSEETYASMSITFSCNGWRDPGKEGAVVTQYLKNLTRSPHLKGGCLSMSSIINKIYDRRFMNLLRDVTQFFFYWWHYCCLRYELG